MSNIFSSELLIPTRIMDSYQHQQGGGREPHRGREQKQPPPPPPPPLTTSISPPSATSSPSHEFSFTISLHSSTAPNTTSTPSKSKNPTSLAIDLSPADDIFFHGHLLPLHLLSHLPVSPRSSANSLDSFTIPIRDFPDDQGSIKSCGNYDRGDSDEDNGGSSCNKSEHKQSMNGEEESEAPRGRSKLRSFSLFGIPRRKKARASEVRDGEDNKEKQKRKKVISFDMTQMLKRYARMVKPLLLFKGRKGEEGGQFRRQSHSFSGNVNGRRKNQELRVPQFSAPASMRTSPTNSGLLVPTTTLPFSTSDQSTMEELQAAIQAAIAHCKNSIAAEEKLKA
ncbi:BRI1 kinase inhibitor 1-like [Rhodamnia argentea]|uniref:BRI1 kinase inhibitor 1-like n=1 Tax=Rhodamnia argentea TaxID=178133 RepID=A0A8B8PSZ6_9MYRT|nr:BRI1 kinase inhibitor 1-like [Rhodamnia argentea]